MRKGFTIVELLIVVVVIAILAAVTIVAYNGITRRASETGIKSDLRNTATKLNMVKSEQGTYPTSLNDSEKSESSTNILSYTSDGSTFCLSGTTKAANGPVFYVTHGGIIQAGGCPSTNIVWSQIAAGDSHSVGLSQDGKVYTWGSDSNNQLGNGATTGDVTRPADISSSGALAGKTITQVAAGSSSSYAVTSTGSLLAWGLNSKGQLGDGTSTPRSSPVTVGGALTGKVVTQVSASGIHVSALTSDGRVYSWGDNPSGQLGDGTYGNNRTTPSATAGAIATKTITKIAVGDNNGYAIASDNTLYGWGLNDLGQVGDQATTRRSTPVSLNLAFMSKIITQFSGGNNYGMALASDGTIFGFGDNADGQLDGGGNTFWSPEDITGYGGGALIGKTPTQLLAAGSASHALTSTGLVIGWGKNASGQIGNNQTINADIPVVITGALSGKTIVKIGGGPDHRFAIDSDGRAYSWGNNASGQLGVGSTAQQRIPTLVLEP